VGTRPCRSLQRLRAGRAAVVQTGFAGLRSLQRISEEVLAKAELLAAERADHEGHAAGVAFGAALVEGVMAIPFLSVAITIL
jgi:hypothetical protein